MNTSSCRTLVHALALSLLLHAVLLSSQARLFPVPVAVSATAISAVIRVERHGAASSPVDSSPARAAGEAAKPSALRAVPLPQVVAAPPAAPLEAPTSAPAREHSAPVSPGAAGRPAAPGAGASAAAPAPGVASGLVAGALAGAVSGDDLRQYRLSLASAARRFKRYPALARQRGWEGTVEVALNVSALAPVPEVVLVRSSGRSVLDEQAVDMLAQAVRVTTLPEGLRARDFRVLLPVQFSLENDQ